MAEAGEEKVVEFKWGKQKRLGGTKKDVRFYESFSYDGVEYFLYDSVFLYKEGELEPYIGKIIKIWETSDKSKKVTILWYFRPSEILNFLEGTETVYNELFLASGEGKGIVNVNPLEAIAGKCNVLCISKDSRNSYPSDEEVQMAEFVFYRFFDVGKREILDKIDDKIAGIEVKNIFNNLDSQKLGLVEPVLDKTQVRGNFMAINEAVALSSQKNSQPLIEKPDGKCFDTLVRENADSKSLLGKKPTSSIGVKEASKPTDALHSISSDKIVPQANVEVNRGCKASLVKQKSSTKLLHCSKAGLEMRETSKMGDGRGNVSIQKNSQPLIEKPDGKCFDTLVRENADSKSLLGKKPTSSIGVKETSKPTDALHSISNDKIVPQANVEVNRGCKASLVKQKSSTKLLHCSKAGLEMRETSKMGDGRGNVSIQKNNLMSRVDSKRDDRMDVGVPVGQINKGLVEEKTSKQEKHGGFDKVSSVKMNNNGQNRRLLTYDDDMETIPPSSSKDKYKRQVSMDSCFAEELPSKKLKIDKKPTKLTNDKFSKERSTISPDVEHKLDYRPMEVTRRPDVDRRKWFKNDIPWEDKMKTAYDQRKLVLLQNLDPSLSSSEVQDIVWTGFKESCTAKVIQKTAHSSPHSGQAFVIFNKKEAAELVVSKLNDGCFLMSNGRPLVGSIGVPCFPEKKPTFYGHLVVDQLRMMQMQREMKDAVSTSHCSQSNNIEYDMAVEWCLLQERAKKSWELLYQRQGKELRKLKDKLKSKFN